ncbi:MAG: antibiotic biosynthesis monooxygenase [Clostridium sp.]|nr:antibiotic biosynthesis monooxygenase [Clostridium sp.]
MAVTINIYYTGEKDNAKQFAKEMTESGIVEDIRAEEGNLRYEYFFPMNDEKTVLLIDSWQNQEAIDLHHQSPMMTKIAQLREKYDLHMRVERYISDDEIPLSDKKFIKD